MYLVLIIIVTLPRRIVSGLVLPAPRGKRQKSRIGDSYANQSSCSGVICLIVPALVHCQTETLVTWTCCQLTRRISAGKAVSSQPEWLSSYHISSLPCCMAVNELERATGKRPPLS